MRARDSVYHIECFRCSVCSRQLLPGDEFSLREHELLCRADHGLLLERAGAGSPRSPGPLPARGLHLPGEPGPREAVCAEMAAPGLEAVPCTFLGGCRAVARQERGWMSVRGSRLWMPVSLGVCMSVRACVEGIVEDRVLRQDAWATVLGAGAEAARPWRASAGPCSAGQAAQKTNHPTQSGCMCVCVFRPGLMYSLVKCSPVGGVGSQDTPAPTGHAMGPGGAEGLCGSRSRAGGACGCGVVWHCASRLCPPCSPLHNDALGLDGLFVNIYR